MMTLIDGSGVASQSSYLGEAIKAMGDHITRKMVAIDERRRLASLESRCDLVLATWRIVQSTHQHWQLLRLLLLPEIS